MRRAHPWKGFLAGALGGLAASFVMSKVHSLVPRKRSPKDNEDATVKAASALSQAIIRRELTAAEKKVAGPAMHYSFGSVVAGIYGAAVELIPPPDTGGGLPFGAAVWLGAHAIAVPALGFSKPIIESNLADEAVEFGAHLLYGTVAESVRRFLRKGSA